MSERSNGALGRSAGAAGASVGAAAACRRRHVTRDATWTSSLGTATHGAVEGSEDVETDASVGLQYDTSNEVGR